VPVASKAAVGKQLQKGKEPVSYWRRYRYFVLAFIAALGLFALCAFLARRQVWVDREIRVFRFINSWPQSLQTIFLVITSVGSFWSATAIVMGAFVLRLYQLTWRLAISVFTTYGLLVVTKELFARHRPEEVLNGIYVRTLEASAAFPSAHTAVATMLALTLRTYIPVPTIWQWLIVLVWIGLVGLSRVYLGVHTPLDVAAGFALGVGVVCFWRIVPTFVKRFLHIK